MTSPGPQPAGCGRRAWLPGVLPLVARYGLALVAVAAALALHLLLEAWVGPGLPTDVMFYPAVMAVALLCGCGPGLLATVLAGLVTVYWLIPPIGSFMIDSPIDCVGLLLFIAIGVFISVVSEAYRHNRRKAASYDCEVALRESEARFRGIFHHSATPMAVKQPDGRFLEVNQAYCKMLGCSEAEVLGTAVENLAHPGDGHAAAAMRRLGAGDITAQRADKRYLHKSGHHVWCDTIVSSVAHADGSLAYVIVQAHEISARKNAEEKIIRLNQHLESRVLERTAELHQTVQVLEAEMAQRQRLEREILEISEREQCRLGQDLHDGLGQELAGIALLGDVHAKKLLAEAHPLAAAAAKIATYTRTTIDSARRLAKGFYPIELERYGLLLALKGLAVQTSQRLGIYCELRQSGDAPCLEPSAEIHVYRIVQECIGNAVKHGRPRRISIDSEAHPAMHLFAVTDDGVGFDHATVPSGMGLNLMHYRARVIGAEIAVETPAQGGCRITCQLSLGGPTQRTLREIPM